MYWANMLLLTSSQWYYYKFAYIKELMSLNELYYSK